MEQRKSNLRKKTKTNLTQTKPNQIKSTQVTITIKDTSGDYP